MSYRFKHITLMAILAVLLATQVAEARIEPSFNPEQATWNATHVILVTPDIKREGALRIEESWKGDLKPNDEAPVRDTVLGSSSKIIWDDIIKPREVDPKAVTNHRVVLFLTQKKGENDRVTWESAVAWEMPGKQRAFETILSTIWIEDGKAYAIQQMKNPGPSHMHPLGWHEVQHLDEHQLKDQVLQLVALQQKINDLLQIEDLGERAKSAQQVMQPKHWYVWQHGFETLRDCGQAAVPVWCEFLKDESLFARHVEIIKQLSRYDDEAATAAFVSVVNRELEYWKKTAPILPKTWRGGKDLPPHVFDSARDHNLRLTWVLESLAKHPTPLAKQPVQDLRDYFLSLPQLDDNKGQRHISKLCDRVLKAIADLPAKP